MKNGCKGGDLGRRRIMRNFPRSAIGAHADGAAKARSYTRRVLAGASDEFRTGDALVGFGRDLRVVSWNQAAERLTGRPAEEALGRYCWELLGAIDERGSLVCHADCSTARLAYEGWPVPSAELLIRTRAGRRRVSVSTIAVNGREQPIILHLLRDGPEHLEEAAAPLGPGPPPSLTIRQRQVLALIAGGMPAKTIAARLGLSEATVRNHIRAILLELGAHSQLEAVAKARRWRIVDD